MRYYCAGAEFIPSIHASMLTYAHRALMTAYPFIEDPRRRATLDYLLEGFGDRPLIMDSGVFTLQGQAKAGTKLTRRTLFDYAAKYVELVRDSGFRGLNIDVDVHDLTPGWRGILSDMRSYMFDQLGDKLLVTWHWMEGMDGWKHITETYPRVAHNYRDLRHVAKVLTDKQGAKVTPVQAARFMAQRAGCDLSDKHCHILGTTSEHMFTLDDNYTCDSTTWSMVVRYGRSFPHSKFPVFWWRRQDLEAPKVVVEAVEEKLDDLYANYWRSPEASKSSPEPKYTLALAYALVASQMVAENPRLYHQIKNGHVDNEYPNGGNDGTHNQDGRGREAAPSEAGKAQGRDPGEAGDDGRGYPSDLDLLPTARRR